MKRTILKISIFSIMIAGLFSCEDFLDREPVDYSTTGFYKSEVAIKSGLEGVYNSLYIVTYYSNRPAQFALDFFTGLCVERTENTTIGAGDALVPDNSVVQQWWTGNYLTISRANSLLSGAEPYLNELNENALQYLAEARVLRAFAYYNLISTYGDVPFFDIPVTVEEFGAPRTSKVDILDFILTELEDASNDLQWIAAERGRVDKAVALGLKARAALLGGSLNYGGKATEYFSTSAAAAQSVIGNRALASNFDDLFTIAGQAKSDVRNEMLFEIMYSSQGVTKFHWIPFGMVSRNYGQTGMHPTQMLADTYECIDGKRIDESPLYDVKNPSLNRDPRFKSTLWMHGDTVLGSTTGGGPNVQFVLDVYNPTTQFYSYSSQAWVERTNADINSSAAWTSFANAGLGFIFKKLSAELSEAVRTNTTNFPIMRYAEVLLTYAEAKIELGELDASVYDAINQVRNRSNMPNVSTDRLGNQDRMRQLVRRERKVELVMEGLHHVDMRRWQIGDLENEGPCYGYPVALSKDANGYITSGGYADATPDMIPNFGTDSRHDLNDIPNYTSFKEKLKMRDANRFWNSRFELWPIPQAERDIDVNLSQNEGY
ncbi:MAG: RagB/SusD family nutrient uptake outer membrane protein [Bacteroidales bacterium]|nr:RagB/SusD family nutrient uptake outer membrane protein [Bacteroidales bacterium]